MPHQPVAAHPQPPQGVPAVRVPRSIDALLPPPLAPISSQQQVQSGSLPSPPRPATTVILPALNDPQMGTQPKVPAALAKPSSQASAPQSAGSGSSVPAFGQPPAASAELDSSYSIDYSTGSPSLEILMKEVYFTVLCRFSV